MERPTLPTVRIFPNQGGETVAETDLFGKMQLKARTVLNLDHRSACLRGLQGRNMIAQGRAQRRPGITDS